ncbi:hypothetical protein K435DRAFT_869874 [Dendrothele bispora CBS 962.96]|uniref:Uncharacterized protein n=1 Tax=Dendrothele bispora (strain CBS 962.96) TaxID=1314807 RepID=A0A4S8L836_DENBC|nr:hypothetical protein K435DRAFT_869874 [Dendrothele bispora CBS 962.96]
MSRSNFFQNTSHSSFEGSHITNTVGDHTTNIAKDHNIYIAGDNITQIIGSQDQTVPNGVRRESILDQYHIFRRGDIRLLQELSTSEVDEEKTPLWDWNPTQKKLKYTRTAHSVKLFGVAGDHSHCVAVHYSGRDAYAAWERDFLRYSNHHQNIVHLLGLNRQKSNPALVFCDDVVPLAQIWEKCPPIVKFYLHVNFIYLAPQTAFGDKDLFRTVGWFKKLDKSYSLVSSPWTSIPGKEGILLEHGWTRFHYDVTNWGKHLSCSVNFPQTLEKRLISAWISQGMFVANATGGDTSKLQQYGVTTRVEIFLTPDVGTVALHPNIMPKNIFMFITPVSLNQCPESGPTKVSSGEHGENYYFWSFDPDGSTQISQRVCDLIGLPKYNVEIYPLAFFCPDYQFQAIKCLQEFFGYNTSTQDFPKACGLPLIDLFPLSEDPDNPHDQSIEELDNWHIVHDNLNVALGSDSESIHDTVAQSQRISFPMPRLRQEMNLTVSEILSYEDLDGSESDSCSEDWSDLGSEASDVPLQYLKPSPWLEGYLISNDGSSKSCRGVPSQDGTRFCWMFDLDVPDASLPVYTECWICIGCHYSHVRVQPVTCVKCGRRVGNQPYSPRDTMVLKVIHKNHSVFI